MTDDRLLDYARSIDHSIARIAGSLEQLVKLADELMTERAAARDPLDRTHAG